MKTSLSAIVLLQSMLITSNSVRVFMFTDRMREKVNFYFHRGWFFHLQKLHYSRQLERVRLQFAHFPRPPLFPVVMSWWELMTNLFHIRFGDRIIMPFNRQ